MMIRRLLCLAASLFALAIVATPATAYVCFSIGRCVRWDPPQAHMKFLLGFAPAQLSNGTFSYDDNAALAAESWNAIGSQFRFSWEVGTQFIDPCGPSGENHVCDNTGPTGDNPVFFANTLCGRNFGDVLAQTTTCYDTRSAEIVNSPVFFDRNVNWDAYDGPLRPRYDIRRVLTHELGHVLGLVHPDDHGQVVHALMNRRISDIDRPQQDDINGVVSIYSAANVAGSQPQGCALAGDHDAAGAWWLAIAGLLLLAASRGAVPNHAARDSFSRKP